MKVLYFGIYSNSPEYPRNRNMVRGLRQNGVEVVECRYAMAENFRDRFSMISEKRGRAVYGLSLLLSYVFLVVKYVRAPRVDAILVGYPGYFHVHLAALLRMLRNRKAALAFDVFFPLYDVLVIDRKIVARDGWFARLIHWWEASACRFADICLIDTSTHASYLTQEYNIPNERVAYTYVGPVYSPHQSPIRVNAGVRLFKVLFVGTYIPLHGIGTILEAAKELRREQQIRFALVGTGQLREEIESQARTWALTNVEFVDWVCPDKLREYIRTFDLALGVFGDTPKADRVIPSKIFDFCAAGIPFITADTSAIREVFRHAEDAYLVPPGDGGALATAIIEVSRCPELMERIATNALDLANTKFSSSQIGKDLIVAMGLEASKNRGR